MKKVYFLICLFFFTQVSAVHINPKGLGDAAIIPYYTVNNNLNTLVSVTNTTADAKAIKINIREGLHGYAALSYNVYLDGYDTWTFTLFPTDSTVAGYEGQKSASHATADTSCAPDLNKSGQEFLPFELTDGPNNLQRTREGFIEIIEMGSITPTSPAFSAAHHGSTPVPANCTYFIQAWQENGIWHEDSGGNSHTNLSPTTGGLMVEAQLVDVADGINYSIPTITLDGFHADATIAHVNPGETSLSLDAAEPVARLIANSKTYQLQFDSGIDAVSAVLMSDKLIATYALDSFVAGKSESIYIQPTRRFYVDHNHGNAQPPFIISSACPMNYGGVMAEQLIHDRESQRKITDNCGTIGTCPPPLPNPVICDSVFVHSFHLSQSETGSNSPITGSLNFEGISTPEVIHATENGFVITEFLQTRALEGAEINTGKTIKIYGLPVIGISLQRFTNASAAEELLAQYGGTQLIKSLVTVVEVE